MLHSDKLNKLAGFRYSQIIYQTQFIKDIFITLKNLIWKLLLFIRPRSIVYISPQLIAVAIILFLTKRTVRCELYLNWNLCYKLHLLYNCLRKHIFLWIVNIKLGGIKKNFFIRNKSIFFNFTRKELQWIEIVYTFSVIKGCWQKKIKPGLVGRRPKIFIAILENIKQCSFKCVRNFFYEQMTIF